MLKRPITNISNIIEDCRKSGFYGLQGKEYRYCITFERTGYEGMTKRTRSIYQYYKTIEKAEKALDRIKLAQKEQSRSV